MVCVCYHASCYIPRLYIEHKVPLGFLWRFQHNIMYCVDVTENALFKSSGDINFADYLSTLDRQKRQ